MSIRLCYFHLDRISGSFAIHRSNCNIREKIQGSLENSFLRKSLLTNGRLTSRISFGKGGGGGEGQGNVFATIFGFSLPEEKVDNLCIIVKTT